MISRRLVAKPLMQQGIYLRTVSEAPDGFGERSPVPRLPVVGVCPNAGRRHGTTTRNRLPADAVGMGAGDRAVGSWARSEHHRGADDRSRAGPRRAGHAGRPGVDTTAGLAGLPRDA